MRRIFSRMDEMLAPLGAWAQERLWPFALLIARIMVARDFLLSGRTKLDYVLNGEVDTLYALFQDYNVPFLPVKAAAWMGMCGELGLSALLLLGLFGRFAALGLIVMSAVIYHVDQNQLAPYWVLACAIIAICGAGKWSVDRVLFKRG